MEQETYNKVEQVRKRPFWKLALVIMLRGSNICWVSSGTVTARKEWAPRLVRGAKPTMKKCRRGKGIMLTANLRRSEFSWPGKRRLTVMPDMTADTRWLRSPYEGEDSFSVRWQMSYRASLSRQKVSSACSTSWCTDRVAL